MAGRARGVDTAMDQLYRRDFRGFFGLAPHARGRAAGTWSSFLYNKEITHGRLEGNPQPAAHRLSHESESAHDRAANARTLGGDGPLRKDSGAPPGGAEVRPARRAAVRERSDPSRHGAQQDPEGLRREVALDGRLRRALHPRL